MLQIRIHNLRNWTMDRHQTVDDRPFGGGEGMVLKPEPVFEAVESIFPAGTGRASAWCCCRRRDGCSTQGAARRLSESDEVLLICGRYEGVDERVAVFGRRGTVDRRLRVERWRTGCRGGGGFRGPADARRPR